MLHSCNEPEPAYQRTSGTRLFLFWVHGPSHSPSAMPSSIRRRLNSTGLHCNAPGMLGAAENTPLYPSSGCLGSGCHPVAGDAAPPNCCHTLSSPDEASSIVIGLRNLYLRATYELLTTSNSFEKEGRWKSTPFSVTKHCTFRNNNQVQAILGRRVRIAVKFE